MNNDIEFDLPGFLHSEIYPHMETGELDEWFLADAINLAEDIRKYDGIDCDPPGNLGHLGGVRPTRRGRTGGLTRFQIRQEAHHEAHES